MARPNFVAAMASFSSLSTELLVAVFGALNPPDQARLSSACRRLRKVGLHQAFIFKSLSLTWARTHVSDSALLVARKYGAMVRELTFFVDPPFYPDGGGDGRDKTAPPLPASFVALLTGRDESGAALPLPRLDRIVLEFPSTFEVELKDGGKRAYGQGKCLYFDCYDHEAPVIRNNALVDAVMEALARRGDAAATTKPITSLKLANFPPRECPSLSTDEWRRFLSRMQDFDLSLYGDGGEPNELFVTNNQVAYLNLKDRLGDLILNRLPQARRLRFYGSQYAPLGAHFERTEDLPWDPTTAPLLQELELGYIFVGSELASLLQKPGKNAAKRPLSVTLTNADAHGSPDWEDETECITWARFFDVLVEQGARFSVFNVTPTRTGFDDYEESDWQTVENPTPTEDAIACREKLAANPGLPVFTYGRVTDKYADWWPDLEETMRSFLAGHDQAAYERFMEEAVKNRHE
ncbi:hypothetical protein RB594_007154 [Gaeumannomyces avenae]